MPGMKYEIDSCYLVASGHDDEEQSEKIISLVRRAGLRP